MTWTGFWCSPEYAQQAPDGVTPADVWSHADRTLSAAGVAAVQSGLATDARLVLVERILRNKMVTDPTTGTLTLYADDGTTVLMTAQLYEDASAGQTYRGKGAERRERLA